MSTRRIPYACSFVAGEAVGACILRCPSIANLCDVSAFGTHYWTAQVRTREQGFNRYLATLQETEAFVETHRPDLLVYQACVGCHERHANIFAGSSTTQLFARDIDIFRMTRIRALQMLFVVAGSYQEAERVARPNANTVRAARGIWRHHSSGARP